MTAIRPDGEPRHLAFVDALRGFAILGVISTHCAANVPIFPARSLLVAGQYGVQLFFIASAFTLAHSWANRREVAHRRAFFFVRRFFRIAPMFWFAAAAYTLWPQLEQDFFMRAYQPNGVHLGNFLAVTCFIQGWTPTNFNAVVPGGWSIAVEMTFYLAFPFIISRLTTLRRTVWAAAVSVVVAFAVSVLGERFGGRLFPDASYSLWRFFSTRWFVTQIPFFVFGIVLFRAWGRPDFRAFFSDRRTAAGIAIIAGLLLACLFHAGEAVMGGDLWIGIAMTACAAAMSGDLPLLTHRLLQHIGRISFSMYLTHFAVLTCAVGWYGQLSAAHPALSPHGPVSSALGCAALWAFVCPAAVLISSLTFRWIEKPGMALGRGLIRRWSAGAVPVAAAAPSAGSGS